MYYVYYTHFVHSNFHFCIVFVSLLIPHIGSLNQVVGQVYRAFKKLDFLLIGPSVQVVEGPINMPIFAFLNWLELILEN